VNVFPETRTDLRVLDLDLLAAILDGMPMAVVVASAPSGEIVLRNDQAEMLLQQLEPRDWPLARALADGESIRGQRIRVERDDGSWLSIEVSASPIRDQAGTIFAAVVVFWDVSERERRERAEHEFITNAAHQLQTPVASIVGAVEVLVGGAKDVPEDRDRFLAHLERESYRLVRILRALLVLARTELAGESVELAPVLLRPLLDDIALALQPARGIEVVVRCPPGLTVLSNGELLEQAVGNLASNSARLTSSGRIVLSAARKEDRVRIEVADTGPGIDTDVERLFARFTQGARGEGFGLGLAIVRQAVTVLGGTVSLLPRRGGGTVGRIILPDPGTEDT
jgi:two-component system phosphate regulon sensor histidine kinase PhoR